MTAEPAALPVPAEHAQWYDALPQLLWLLDPRGRVLLGNAAWREFAAWPAPDDRAATFTDVVHPDDRADAWAAWEDATARGGPYRAVFRARRRDGQYRSVQADGHPPRGAASGVWTVTCTDVHAREQEQRNLAARASMLQDIVDANADCIKILSPDARLLSMNVGGMRVMEVDDFNACLNAVWPEFWQGDTRPLVEAALERARAGGTGHFEGFCPTMKGAPRWWHVTITPIRDDTGEVVNLLATSRDITARKHAEDELRDLNADLEARVEARTRALNDTVDQLQRSNTELERFAYIAAHDLQEPIRTVSSFAGILAERYGAQLDARGVKYLDFVQSGARRMKALVDDLLIYSRLTHDQPTLQPVPAGVPLDEAMNRLEGRLSDQGATVVHSGLPTVLGDGPQLAQVFQNLIGNAVKFARTGVPPRVSVDAGRDGDMWHFTVADNGIGMENEYLEKVFAMFQRLHSRDEFEGTGLGLSVCQKIVEGHGGRIWAESVPGEGSTLHFTLRAAPDAEDPAAT